MNILDENIEEGQRTFLRKKGYRTQQIGLDIGRSGMTDQDVLPLLRDLHRATFFTRDRDYYRSDFCHAKYCLVFLDVLGDVLGSFIVKLLRHPEFRTWSSRKGTVLRVTPTSIGVLRRKAAREERYRWQAK